MSDNIGLFQNQNILVLGDIMLDSYIYGNAVRISPEAPVPVLSVESTRQCLGGAGNLVNNITSLGASVRLLSYWGIDSAGDEIYRLLECMGVDISFTRRYADFTTIQKTRLVSKNHHLMRYDIERIEETRAEYMAMLSDNLVAIFDMVNALVISDYGKGLVSERAAQILIKHARARNIPIIVDPKGHDYSKYCGATVCTPNLKELKDAGYGSALISDDEILEAGIKLINDCKLEFLLVTRSEKGISLIERGKKKDFLATAQDVSDVTGAGDTVAAVFALGLGAGLMPEECCRLANKAAGIVVAKFGAATVSPEELTNTGKLKNCGRSLSEDLRLQGKKIVFTNGCFDLIHAGHIASFEQARSFGDVLIIGLNSDRSVRAIKGADRPIVSQDNRAKLLCALDCVDFVIIFDEDRPERLIQEIMPDVLVKGADWRGKAVAGQEAIEANGGEVVFLELEQGLSTTEIINKVKDM
jgi:D-beta-D-heptose 7-phosphate kinase/D-beta-D-heptose 1-phosphate adenosyltransferase